MTLALCLSLGAMGCWDASAVEDKDIVTAVVVDKTDSGYSFTVEIASISQGGGSQGGTKAPESKVLKGEGKTFVAARESLERKSDKLIDLSAVQSVVFTENMLYDDITQYMQRFRHNPAYRKTVYVAGTRVTPDDLMKATSENNTLVGTSLYQTFLSLIKNGQMYEMTMGDILTSLSCEYKGYLIPAVDLSDGEITLIGFYAMEGGACKGFVPVEGSSGIVHFHTKSKPIHYSVEYKGLEAAFAVDMKKAVTRGEYRDGKVRLNIRFSGKATLQYLSEEKKVTDEELNEMGETLKQDLRERHMEAVKTSQRVGVDYLDLHEAFRIQNPDIYKELDWSQVYPDAEINMDMDVEIRWGTIDYKEKEGE